MGRAVKGTMAAVLLQGLQAYAATGWNETSGGDLSGDGLAPTAVSVAIGTNLFKGTVGDAGQGVDRDYFTFTLPANTRLSAIIVNPDTFVSGSYSFFAIQAGPQVTVTPTGGGAQALLGFTHYENADIGNNILPRIVSTTPGLGGELPGGTYSFWIQETGGTVAYSFGFQVTAVPEAPALWMLGLGLLTIARAVRRR